MNRNKLFSFGFAGAAVLCLFGALSITSRPEPHPKAEIASLSVPVAPDSVHESVATIDPIVIEAELPKHAAGKPTHRKHCDVLPLNVEHVHTTNTDVRIKGDGSVKICR